MHIQSCSSDEFADPPSPFWQSSEVVKRGIKVFDRFILPKAVRKSHAHAVICVFFSISCAWLSDTDVQIRMVNTLEVQ